MFDLREYVSVIFTIKISTNLILEVFELDYPLTRAIVSIDLEQQLLICARKYFKNQSERTIYRSLIHIRPTQKFFFL